MGAGIGRLVGRSSVIAAGIGVHSNVAVALLQTQKRVGARVVAVGIGKGLSLDAGLCGRSG
jgi:hypothetical protein